MAKQYIMAGSTWGSKDAHVMEAQQPRKRQENQGPKISFRSIPSKT
jgi:hypothetical protein